MSEAKPNQPRPNISFRFQLPPNSRYAPLAEFFKSESPWAQSKQEKVLNPMDAYWMPFALQQMGASEAEIQEAVLASIYHLSLHLKLIMSQFKVTDEVLCQQALATLNPFVPPALSREPKFSEPESSPSESDLEPDYDYDVSDFSADDDILNQFT